MMTVFDKEIQNLLIKYDLSFNEDEKGKGFDTLMLSDEQRQKLQIDLVNVMIRGLTLNGREDEAIEAQYKELRKLFHPDKIRLNHDLSNLERAFSENTDNGVCFKLLTSVKDSLIQQNSEERLNPENLKSKKSVLSFLREKEKLAVLILQKNFYRELINLLQDIENYQQNVSNFQSRYLRVVAMALPFLSSTCCLSFFASEIFFIYTLSIIGMSVGQVMLANSMLPLRAIGGSIYSLSNNLNLLTGQYAFSGLRLQLWACGYAVSGVQYFTKGFPARLLDKNAEQADFMRKVAESEARANASPPAEYKPGQKSHTECIDHMMKVLQDYVTQASQQRWCSFRRANYKIDQFNLAIFYLSQLKNKGSSVNLFERLEEVIDRLKRDEKVYANGAEAIKAINKAAYLLIANRGDLEMQQPALEHVSDSALMM